MRKNYIYEKCVFIFKICFSKTVKKKKKIGTDIFIFFD